MTERMKGHGKEYKPPVFGKLASSTQVVILTSGDVQASLLSSLSHTAKKIMTLIDKRRQAF